jgi:hypothetical protein
MYKGAHQFSACQAPYPEAETPGWRAGAGEAEDCPAPPGEGGWGWSPGVGRGAGWRGAAGASRPGKSFHYLKIVVLKILNKMMQSGIIFR